MTRKKWAQVFLLFSFLTAGCGRSSKTASQSNPPNLRKVVAVSVGYQPVRRKDFPVIFQYTASILPVLQADIRPKASGWLTKVYVNTGDPVQAGQVLAEMDRVQMEQAVRQARENYRSSLAGVTSARAVYENDALQEKRLKKLYSGGYISEQQYDNARTTFLSDQAVLNSLRAQALRAEASFRSAEADLADTYLRAPFSGVVVSRNLDPGAYLSTAVTSSSVPVATIADNRKLKVIVYVADQDVPRIHPGQTVKISVDAVPGKSFPGRVTRIAGGVDPQSRTLSAEIDVDNPDGKLVPGMFAKVFLMAAIHRHALVLPLEAVVRDGKKTSVWIVSSTSQGWKAENVPVKLGEIQGSEVQILQGLQGDEKIVTDGKEMIHPGVPLNASPSFFGRS